MRPLDWAILGGAVVAWVIICAFWQQRQDKKRTEDQNAYLKRRLAVTQRNLKAAERTINECPAGCPSCADVTEPELAARVLRLVES